MISLKVLLVILFLFIMMIVISGLIFVLFSSKHIKRLKITQNNTERELERLHSNQKFILNYIGFIDREFVYSGEHYESQRMSRLKDFFGIYSEKEWNNFRKSLYSITEKDESLTLLE